MGKRGLPIFKFVPRLYLWNLNFISTLVDVTVYIPIYLGLWELV